MDEICLQGDEGNSLGGAVRKRGLGLIHGILTKIC